MRVLTLIALVAVPLLIWPSVWTLLAVLAAGLPAAIALMGEEKPSELDPAVWHPDPTVRAGRLLARMDQWRERRNRR